MIPLGVINAKTSMNIATMNSPVIKIVFDRKHISTKTIKGLVQIELSYKRKRKYVSTGVKVYKDQWSDRKHVVNSVECLELNERIDSAVRMLNAWITINHPFSWEKLESYLSGDSDAGSFVDFVRQNIDDRNTIAESTKKTQRKLITLLAEYGKIETFADLTPSAILDFDNWMHGRRIKKYGIDGREYLAPMRQNSIYDYHKFMKVYIGMAVRRGMMKENPYRDLHFRKGEGEEGRFLTEDELRSVENADMPNGSTARARDLFLFQCYTGLSYADIKTFDFGRTEIKGMDTVYRGKREKTGEPFFFVLTPKAKSILEKYGHVLPVISIEGYNAKLKDVAMHSGLRKPLSSHWARRTAATVLINRGVRAEVIARILGHGDMATTMKFYARVSDKTVADEMKKAGL